MILLGIDPGSAHVGLVVVDAPRIVDYADTTAVDPARIDIAVNAILDVVVRVGASVLVVEHGRWFPRAGASPAALMASQAAHLVCHDLVRELQRVSPVPVEVIPRQTWAHRVVPRHRGGIGDDLVRAALPAHLEGAHLLADVHQRDAAGVVLGYLLAPPPRPPKAPRAPRPPKPRGKRVTKPEAIAAQTARRSARRVAVRVAAGCTCPPGRPGRHPVGCPLYRPKVRGPSSLPKQDEGPPGYE